MRENAVESDNFVSFRHGSARVIPPARSWTLRCSDLGGSSLTESDKETRKAQLEELFGQWDARSQPSVEGSNESLEGPDDGFYKPDTTRWRGLFALLVAFVSGYVMYETRHEFSYWLQDGSAPVNLGDLKKQWKAGDREIAFEDNTYVAMSGLLVTRAMEPVKKADEEVDTERKANRYFLCPLFNLLVRTEQPFPEAPGHAGAAIAIDPAFLELIQNRLVFPENLETTFAGEGRLVRVRNIPRSAQTAVSTYKKSLPNRDIDSFYVFLDGDLPSEYSHYAILWGAAVAVPILPFFLFARAWNRRRRQTRTVG